MNYAAQRIAEIRAEQMSQAADLRLRVVEKAIVSDLREERRKPSKAERELDGMNNARVGYTYFIRSGDLVKIGFSSNVIDRLATLQTGNPLPAKLIAIIPGTEDTEIYFHKMFAEYRDRGEWFRFEGKLADYLRYMPSHVPLPERQASRAPVEGYL